MKRSTMEKLCEADDNIRIAAKYGFDFPTIKTGLDEGHSMLSQECLGPEDIQANIKAVVDRLNLEDLGRLVDWLFKPNNIDPDSLIPNMLEYYASEAEMWLDENRERITSQFRADVQEMYDTLQREDIPQRELLENDLVCKLVQLEELGAPVYLEEGVYLYMPEDALEDDDQ